MRADRRIPGPCDPFIVGAYSVLPLTAKQDRFCQEYLTDLNATQAAIRAGYSARTARSVASENLTKPDVAARVAALQAKRAAKVEVTQEYVLRRLVENLERSMQVESVRDREGNETGEFVYHGTVANGALTLLGKHIGMFGDKAEVSGEVTIVVKRSAIPLGNNRIAALTNGTNGNGAHADV